MIIILGMHRSGTSAITNILQAMGVYLGAPDELLPASADNPEGFFEREDTLAANRLIMQHHHSNWHQVEYFDAPTAPLPAAIPQKILEVLANLKPHAPFALKDPRFCYTLPYWLQHAHSPVIILAIRHPAAIAHSLMRRNNIPPPQGLALWENYMTRALKNIKGLPVIRCQFEKFLTHPEEQTLALHAQLAAHFPSLELPTMVPITPALAHATSNDLPLNTTQKMLYDRLCQNI